MSKYITDEVNDILINHGDRNELVISCYSSDNKKIFKANIMASKICEFLNNEQTFNEILLENRALKIENERLNKVANEALGSLRSLVINKLLTGVKANAIVQVALKKGGQGEWLEKFFNKQGK